MKKQLLTKFTPDEETQRFIETLRQSGFMENSQILLRFIVDRVKEVRISEVAATMALTSILAMVPILALTIAMFAAFPFFAESRQGLENMILSAMLPDQYSDVIIAYMREFTHHAAGLTTFGILGLAVTAVILLYRLFSTLDYIFKIRTPRPLSQRALIFWALLTMGPVAIAVSVSMGAHVANLVLQGYEQSTSRLLYSIGQIFIQAIAFALIYKLVPNCRVNFGYALIGGFTVTTINQCIKDIFSYYVASGTLGSVYGTFVAIPVFILWIYIAWYLFFIGATVTATLPQLIAGRYADQYRVGNEFFTALKILKVFVGLRAMRQRPVLKVFDMCHASETSPESARRILQTLEDIHYVSPLNRNQRDEMWALIADSKNDTLLPVFQAFCLNPDNTAISETNQRVGNLSRWWLELSSSPALTKTLQEALLEKDEPVQGTLDNKKE